ncbi:MAG: hypothetical protein JRF15_11385 [Deltaproteobacteria bacterium]|nr:hypothetical protein [Deltaproteobacteria bacterium]
MRMLKHCWKTARPRKRTLRALGPIWLVVAIAAATAAVADGEVEAPPESVSLDDLLTLPSALPGESSQQRGGLSRGEWSSRFAAAEAEVEAAKADLDESLDKLTQLMGKTSNWKVGAPGVQAGPDEGATTNYGLKQEIRRKREEVERAERKLIDLVVEANLADVPEDWYKKPDSPQ